MAFIGIITSKRNEEGLKKALIQNLNNVNLKHNIIVINENNIENIKNVKFDTIVINEENPLIFDKNELIKNFLKKIRFLILNSDIYNNIELINKLELNIITYGLNLRATVTASSIESDKICISLQRTIENSKGNIIEPKEISLEPHNMDVYRLIICCILVMLYS